MSKSHTHSPTRPLHHFATARLGSRPVTALVRLATRERLRALAYHDVVNAAAFARQLDIVLEHYRPVRGEQVAAAVQRGHRLPPRAIWLTFDDALPGVFDHALPILKNRGVPATLFVCPGVVDSDQPYWWQTLDAAVASGHGVEFAGKLWSDRSVITHVKQAPDDLRRATVAHAAQAMAASNRVLSVRQATTAMLKEWLAAGFELGNHTWDHPCLDTCSDAQQRHQIVAAHRWLNELAGEPTRLFAFPNGNSAHTSSKVLAELGYVITALFDHRMSRARSYEVSRLRVDADAPADRFAAIVSGAHPTAFALARRIGLGGTQ